MSNRVLVLAPPIASPPNHLSPLPTDPPPFDSSMTLAPNLSNPTDDAGYENPPSAPMHDVSTQTLDTPKNGSSTPSSSQDDAETVTVINSKSQADSLDLSEQSSRGKEKASPQESSDEGPRKGGEKDQEEKWSYAKVLKVCAL